MNEILAWLTALVAVVVPGFGTAPTPGWNGYVEAAYVYVSAPSTGTVASIHVREGDTVETGATLFALGDAQYRALAAAADARVSAAEANLDNLMTGSRQDEIDVIRASVLKAQADLNLARETVRRSERLFAQGLTPQAKLDEDRARLASADASVQQLEAQLKVAELPARAAQQAQAEANLAVALAEARKARADLADRTVVAPVAGRVERVYFSVGETAAAGTPFVALLPAGALKVKFYLPEADRARFALGQTVAVSCSGCIDGLSARLSHVASDPQFTPPIIYSRDERHRMTFLAEAVLQQTGGLSPGQPVTIERLD